MCFTCIRWTMRYAVKVAYDGSLFHGSQRQGDDDPDSVEGTIVNAMKQFDQYDGKGDWPIEFSSRTDAGVSALGNVFAVETDMDIVEFMKALNARMNGVWCIAWGVMRERQNVRWANSRWYRYHLPPGELDLDQLKALGDALALFVGGHDFTNFCKLEEGRDPETLVERANAIDVTGTGEMILCDIVGSRFLWNQVRRMVAAAVAVAKGSLSVDDIKEMLEGNGKKRDKVITMPPTGLVLMDVNFKDIEFVAEREAVELARKRNSEDAWKASMRVVLDSAMRSLLK